MNIKGLILAFCFIIVLVLIFGGEELIHRISLRYLAVSTFLFSLVITILLFYVF